MPTRGTQKPRKILAIEVIIAIVLFGGLAYHYFSRLNAALFSMDEFAFLSKTYYFDLLFNKGNVQDARWHWRGDHAQPKLGPYIFGLTLHLAGIADIERELARRDFATAAPGTGRQGLWWYQLDGQTLESPPTHLLPKLELVWLGRRTAVIFTLILLLLVYTFAWNLRGPMCALLSTLLLGMNSLLFIAGRRAMTDSMLLTFFFINLLLTIFFLQVFYQGERRAVLFTSLALGLNASLGFSVKLSGVLLTIYIGLILLFLLAIHRRSRQRILLLLTCLVISASSFLVLTIALHPYLYRQTPSRLVSMFTNRAAFARRQQLQDPTSAVSSRSQALRLLVSRTLLPSGNYRNFRLNGLPFDLLLFLAGLWLIGKKGATEFSRKTFAGETVLLFWVMISLGGLTLYLQQDWDRYYLPSVSAITLTQAYALTRLVEKLRSWIAIRSLTIFK